MIEESNYDQLRYLDSLGHHRYDVCDRNMGGAKTQA
jgi:hypothetical protein